ncbi:MAG: hypothetical protein AMJ60_09745 [Desulfobacterales bacterium SG8_35]|nr:MAG: hypothetical protein AMJ60_09745 [Desulfobacterales bacterium SG8_35]
MRFRFIILSCLFLVAAGCSADDPTRHNTYIPLTSMEVTGAYGSMADQTVNQYKVIGDFSGKFSRDITTEVSWIIENDTIVSVSIATGSEGLVTALAPGETSVTAMYGDFTGSAPVVVTDAFLTGIEITPGDAQLQSGIIREYEADGTFSDDSIQDITSLATWDSSDPDVATIDNSGLVKTSATGTTTITATWQGIEAATSLSVIGSSLTEITISPEEGSIAQGTTAQFEAQATYSDGTTEDITDMVDWESSDTAVALIYDDGLATGIAPGEIEISAAFVTDGDTLSATAALTITDAVIDSIILTPENSTIAVGASQQFGATGIFSDNSEQDITDLVNWFTSNNSVGTISNSFANKGLFISIASGAVTIEATFGGVSGETLLTVE